MASGVSGDASRVENTPGSPSTSSDSDTANTSTSRVYFGPPQSAERRLVRARDSLQQTPIRRSTRRRARSSLHEELPESDEGETSTNEVVAFDLSRPETPTLAEDAMEEPSSALATKVMRAWDNPSPPPSPPLSPRRVSTDDEAAQLMSDTGPSLASSDVEIETNILSEATDAAVAPPGEGAQDSSVSTPLPAEAEADDMDLINFDSFTSALPGSAPTVQLMPATPPRPSPVATYSVDDLLAPTPLRPLLRSDDTTPAVLEHDPQMLSGISEVMNRDGSASVDGEAQVLIVLHDGCKDASASSPQAVPIDELEKPQEPLQADIPVELAPSTPLRRSTRPRRSVSPYVTPLTASPSKLADLAPGNTSPSKLEVGPARRKKTKAKELDDEKLELFEAHAACPDNDMANIVLEDVELPPPAPVTPLAEEKGKGKESEAPQRLGSLSPTSTNLLMQLLPSEPTPGVPGTLDCIEEGVEAEVPREALSEEVRPSSPPLSNEVTTAPATPVRKMFPQPSHEATRTPARRVPIAQAISQGTVSPAKPSIALNSSAADGGFLGAPVFRPRAPEDTLRSPAKRVPVSQAMSSLRSPTKPSSRLSSPVKSKHVRSLSEDPIQPAVPRFQRSMSAEPARPGQPSLKAGDIFRKPGSTQSNPLRSAQRQNEPTPTSLNIPPPIQETDEVAPQSRVPQPKFSSGVRPPTGKIESKIPRPGAKPYVRPPPAGSTRQIPRPTTSLPKKTLPAASASTGARPIRMVRKVMSKPVEVSSGSDDNVTHAVAGPGPSTAASRAVKPLSIPSNESGSPALKRKRDTEEQMASPSGVRPIVLMRRVAPTQKPAPKAEDSSPLARDSPGRSPGPSVVQGKIRMRKVIHKKKASSPPRAQPPNSEPMEIVHSPPASPAQPQATPPPLTSAAHEIINTPTDTTNLPQSSVSGPEPDSAALPLAPTSPLPSVSDFHVESEPESSHGLRRTTRSRKSAQSTSDVFGPVAPLRSQSRRRATIVLSDNSVFSGMTALALKSLTTTNTQRNQKQVAEIQTEVIMKEGKRPDSPTTKVRTSLEQQREERIQQRHERAARRARRSGDGLESDAGEQNDGGDVSMSGLEKDEEGAPLRHQRGPGDEEEYVTPERPERPAKRTRLDVDQGENSDSKNERRVKWDRGLATTVYLDDTPPKPKRHPNDVVPKRGALAPSAKKLPLDTMGNVLNPDAPLHNVRSESIVVKKFVYEDDESPMSDPPPPPPPKPTRSKAKKARS